MKYFYGIVEKDHHPARQLTLQDKIIEIIPFKDVAALTAEAYFPSLNALSQEQLITHLAAHQVIIEEAMQVFPGIIPIKFGTIVPTERIREVLENNYQTFKDIFKKINGKVEWDLIAVWNDLKSVLQEISESDPKIKSYRDEIREKSYPAGFVDRVEIGKMVAIALEKKRSELAKELHSRLIDLTGTHRNNPLMDDTMLLNVAMLIPKAMERDLDNRLKDLDRIYRGELNFRLVGPLPPYSFYTFKVKDKEEFEIARQVMGLKEVTLPELKKVYREKARELHPDHSQEAEEKFDQLTKAYRHILDYLKKSDISEDL